MGSSLSGHTLSDRQKKHTYSFPPDCVVSARGSITREGDVLGETMKLITVLHEGGSLVELFFMGQVLCLFCSLGI